MQLTLTFIRTRTRLTLILRKYVIKTIINILFLIYFTKQNFSQ